MANTQLLSKIPPQNVEAEAAVLGAILVNKEAMDKIADIITDQDFYRQDNQIIFRAILRLFDKRSPIDLVTLTNELEGLKQLDQVGGAAYLAELVNAVPSAIHVTHYAEIVRQKAVLRRILGAGQKIAELGYEEDRDVQEVLDEAEKAVFEVSHRLVKDNFLPIADILASSFDRIDRLHREKGVLRGVTTGFKDLDSKLSGLQPSDLIILAARPSMGKCVAASTKIFDPITGKINSIKEIVNKKSGRALSLDGNWRFQDVNPSNYIYDGKKPTFKVSTAMGNNIEATLPHPFLTISGWKHLAELKVGERVATAKNLPYFGCSNMPEYKVKTLAYMIADGSLGSKSPRFTNVNRGIIADFIESVTAFGLMKVKKVDSGGTRATSWEATTDRVAFQKMRLNWAGYFSEMLENDGRSGVALAKSISVSASSVSQWRSGSNLPNSQRATMLKKALPALKLPAQLGCHNPLADFLIKQGIFGQKASENEIPEVIFTLKKGKLALFINRLFSCDGTAYVAKCGGKDFPVIAYASVSRKLIEQVQHLLTRFGIVSSVRAKNTKLNDKIFPSYELEIHGHDDLNKFCQQIGIYGKEKAVEKVSQAIMTTGDGWTKDTLPIEIWQTIDRLRAGRSWRSIALELGLPESHNFHAYKRAPRRETVLRFAKVLKSQELSELAISDVFWDRITSIVPVGMQDVYDMTIPNSHNYVANNFIVHNTTMALNMALSAAVKGKTTTGFFSLEQSKEQIVDRLICAQAMVDGWKLRTGNLSEDDFPAIGMAMGTLAEAPLFIDDSPGLTILEIRTRARRLKAEHNLGLLVIDYLQLIEGSASRSNSDNRVQQVSDISRNLKMIARELDIPVVALSQLSRAVESRDKKIPQLSDLRESGCLTGKTKIIRADTGRVYSMQELAQRQRQEPIPVFSMDDNFRVVVKPMTKVFSSGKKEVFELKTKSGRTIEASANHPFYRLDGWRRLDQLKAGEKIALPRALSSTNSSSALCDEELILLAHLLGDGCVLPHQPIHYTSADKANINEVGRVAEQLFGIKPRLVKQKNWWHLYLPSPFRLARGRRHPITNFYLALGLEPVRSWSKKIPWAVCEGSDRSIALFLHHLWATDGNISVKRMLGRLDSAAIYYSSTSLVLAQQVQHLLLRLGINSTIRKSTKKGYRLNYQVHIQSAPNQLEFLRKVGCYGERGKACKVLVDKLAKITANPNSDVLPKEIWQTEIADAKLIAGVSWRTVSARAGTSYSGSSLFNSAPSRERLGRIAVALDSKKLGDLASSGIYWDEIESIIPFGIQETFDATVPGTHNFVANDIIVHNSIEQDADVVMFMYREDYYERETERKNITDILIRKHRNGPIGEIELHFRAEQSRFFDLERKTKQGSYTKGE